MLNNPQPTFTEEEVLNFYKENYKTKICSEIRFEDTIPELLLKQYKKFQRSSCCIRPLSLLIYSIIILIIACAGFYFAISENKGYKAYKGVLERNMSLIDNTFPHEHETIKFVKYLTTPREDDATSCHYILYSLGICTEAKYRNFCTSSRYSEQKCNYMDRQYNLGNSFTCDLSNYKSGLCDQVQYIDYLETTQGITYVSKIDYTRGINGIEINLRSFLTEKIFCNIGDYDRPIYLSFIIILFIFIILLIFDLTVKKKTLTSGVKYYIIVTFYMIYYVLLRIYAILFFILLYYGVFVCFLHPTTADESETTGGMVDDPFINKGAKIYFPEDKKWKDERIYALIFCGICLVLFIMVLILCSYKRLLYNYLSFNFDEKNEAIIDANIAENNNNTEILRKASIKVGKISCDFQIKQNKELYLEEKRSKLKFSFKEVIYQNETYFLKCNNLGLKDQLAWSELYYPNSNEIFYKLISLIKSNIAISFFILTLFIWKMKDDPTYDYYLHLIDLGYRPKKYKYFQNSEDYNDSFYNYIAYIYLILGIFLMFCLGKVAYFGGFKNIILTWIGIVISIIIALLNIAAMIISIFGYIYNFFAFLNFPTEDFDFKENMFILKFMMMYLFYMYIFIISMVMFIQSLTLISPLNRAKRENLKLSTENKTSEDMFKYVSFENMFWTLEVVNNKNLPKHLFYTKKIMSNPLFLPVLPKSENRVICLQMNNEEILEDKDKALLQFYKYKEFDFKRIISRIILQIIYSGIQFILIIVLLCLSCNSNDYYKAYRDYLIEYDKLLSNIGLDSLLPTYVYFWCDFGDIESDILISLLVFIIIYLGFEIFSLLVHKIVIKIDYNNGIFAKILLFANMIYYILFKIYLPLLVFLAIYTIVIFIYSPHDASKTNILENIFVDNVESELNKDWNKKKFFVIASFILKIIFTSFFAVLLKVKYHIIEYLNKLYEESDDEEEQENNKINVEKNEVTTSICINNIDYDTRVKLNDILYLQELDVENKGKKFKFKKIYIQNITQNFIYIRLGQNAITDRISNAHWNYPDINYIFGKLGDMCDWIYMILFFSVPLFKLHVENEFAYSKIKLIHKGYENSNVDKPLFADIFDMYGSFEKGLTESRFALYIVQLVFIFALMLKRIFFGGFNKSSNLLVVFIINIIFLVQNIIYVIFDFLLILFSIFCVVCYYKNKYNSNADATMDAKFFLQIVLNADMFVNNLSLLKENVILTIYLNRLRKAMDKFIKREDNIDENEPIFKPVEFKYVSLDGNICSLKEFNNGMLQRYLFYNSDGAENNQKIEIVTNELNTKGENKIRLQEDNEVVIHQNKNTMGQTIPNSDTIGIKENIDENNQDTEKI